MNDDFSAATIRVQEFLLAHGGKHQIQKLPSSTATALEAANALNVQVAQIAKSIGVLLDGERPLVVIIAGDRQVDLSKVADFFEVSSARMAKAKEIKEFTGMPIGGVSAFGLPDTVSVAIDSSLSETQLLYIAAGHTHAVVQTSFEELTRITKAKVHTFAAGAVG